MKNYFGSIIKEIKWDLLEFVYSVILWVGSNLINIVKFEKDEFVYFILEKIVEDGVIEFSN